MSNKMDSKLNEVKVEVIHNPRRHTHGPMELAMEKRVMPKVSSQSNDFHYVNNAYDGSLNSINENRQTAPPTCVIREQYWTCSKWPFAQRVLAIAVGVLMGAVIGLAISVVLRGKDGTDFAGIFRSAPD